MTFWSGAVGRREVPPVSNLLSFRPWVFGNDPQQSNVLELSCCTRGLHQPGSEDTRAFFKKFALKKRLHLHKSGVCCCSGPFRSNLSNSCKEVQLESESDSSGAEAEELKRVEVSWTEPPPELHPRTDDATGVLVWTSVDGLNLRVDEPQNKKWSYSLGNSNISHYIRT